MSALNSKWTLGVQVEITLAASATTDGMDITVQLNDAMGRAIDTAMVLDVWLSEDAAGLGLTADSYSGDVTVVTGAELVEHTAKKYFTVATDATGTLVMLAVDSANPTDQYVAVRHPYSGEVIVSAISGTSWEGA